MEYTFITNELSEVDLIQNYCTFTENEIFRILTILIISYIFIFFVYHIKKDLAKYLEMIYFRILFIPFSFFAGLILIRKGFDNRNLISFILLMVTLICLIILVRQDNVKKWIKNEWDDLKE